MSKTDCLIRDEMGFTLVFFLGTEKRARPFLEPAIILIASLFRRFS